MSFCRQMEGTSWSQAWQGHLPVQWAGRSGMLGCLGGVGYGWGPNAGAATPREGSKMGVEGV